jgi:hypothetical protein
LSLQASTVGKRPNFNQFLHKLHHRLTKFSAVPILMSSQRQDEMQWEERAAKTGRSNVGNCGLGVDLRRRFCLRLWREGVALAQAIGKISSLRALYSRGNRGGTKSVAVVMVAFRAWPICRAISVE